MVEMLMENERVERLRLRQIGEGWIQVIVNGTPGSISHFCQPEVASNLLTPKRFITFENVTDLSTKIQEWFGDCSDIHVEQSRVAMVGERVGIFYRFLLNKQGSRKLIEQQVYCTVENGRITQLHLLCSGFQSVNSDHPIIPDRAALESANLLEFFTDAEKDGSTCALLTPAIKTKLREMSSGQVLEVRVDDPSARGDIEAWCRLSGNTLRDMAMDGPNVLRFFIQKK